MRSYERKDGEGISMFYQPSSYPEAAVSPPMGCFKGSK
jgi:hypothetical protein